MSAKEKLESVLFMLDYMDENDILKVMEKLEFNDLLNSDGVEARKLLDKIVWDFGD